jgi:hypothetical protein
VSGLGQTGKQRHRTALGELKCRHPLCWMGMDRGVSGFMALDLARFDSGLTEQWQGYRVAQAGARRWPGNEYGPFLSFLSTLWSGCSIVNAG